MASSTCSQTHSSEEEIRSFNEAAATSVAALSMPQSPYQHYVASSDAAGVAAAPQRDNETLYESLLRYHQEHDNDTTTSEEGSTSWAARKRHEMDLKMPSTMRQISEDDRKLPAKPTGKSETPKRTSRTRQRRNQVAATPEIEKASSFYKAAFAEAVTMEQKQPHTPPPPPPPSESYKPFSPKASKPGVVMVNEPGMRPDSAMYRAAYGDGSTSDGRSRSTSPTASASPTFPDTDDDRGYVSAVETHHVDEATYQTSQSFSTLQPHTVSHVQHLSWSRDNHSNQNIQRHHDPRVFSGNLEHPDSMHHMQQNQNLKPEAGTGEAFQDHPSFLPTAESGPSYVGANLNKSRSLNDPDIHHDRHYRRGRDVKSNSPPHYIASDTPSPPSVATAPPQETKRNPGNSSKGLFFFKRSPADAARKSYAHDEQSKSNYPTPQPAGGTTTIHPGELMDFGSDDHIRATQLREQDRRNNQNRNCSGLSSRGSSPERSINTTVSTPAQGNIPNNYTAPPAFRRRSPQRGSSHSVGPTSPPNQLPSVLLKPPPPSQPSTLDLGIADPTNIATENHRQHRSRPVPLYPNTSPSQSNLGPLDMRGVFDFPHASNPDTGIDHNSELKVGTVSTTYLNDDPRYVNASSNQREHHYRHSAIASARTDTRFMVPNRNSSNPNLPSSKVGSSLQDETTFRPRSNSFGSHSGRSHDSSSIDEDLRLALELSRQEAPATSVVKDIQEPAPALITNHDRRSTKPYNRSRKLYPSTSPVGSRSKPSILSGEADRARSMPADNDMDDLMLAIKISAEEAERAGNKAAPSDIPRSAIPEIKKETEPDEQYRILQQIREEKEKMDLELALKASQAEAVRESSDCTTPHAPSLTNQVQRPAASHDATRDFLISQQKAMEEYQRNRSTTTRPQTNTDRRRVDGRRQQLLDRGTSETRQAISSGQAQIVQCRKCGARLQAPVTYSLVFCPNCETVSPA